MGPNERRDTTNRNPSDIAFCPPFGIENQCHRINQISISTLSSFPNCFDSPCETI
jgi:hypothetical protein